MTNHLTLAKVKNNFIWFFKKIKDLVSWIPVVWNDEQYNHYYFFCILKKKLEMMESFYRSDLAFCEDSLEIASDIAKAIELTNRLVNAGEYRDEAFIEYDKKYPIEERIKKLRNCNGHYPSMDKDERKIFNEAWDKQEQLIENDLDELFSLLRNNIRGWWD